jgi:hypothetical protein
MKSEKYTLVSEKVRDNLIVRICELPLDGKYQATLSGVGSKSARQRGYEWVLYEFIAKSGKGGKHEDEKNGVHMVCKYRFAVPILLRDDPFFAEIWEIYKQLYNNDAERMEWFVANQVHTEKLITSQMAEYLTELLNSYNSRGFGLPDPDDKKLLDYMK